MSRRSIELTDPVYDYLISVSLRETDLLRQLREETASHPRASMQISPEQGQFMALLARLIGVRRYLEVGVFTGYSSLSIAQSLPDDGQIVACDVSEEFTSIARRYWEKAGVADKVDLRLAPALETLGWLKDQGMSGEFDMAFIDADKGNMPAYFDLAVDLVRPNGLILLDNVLWSGKVADQSENDEDTVAIRTLNEKVHLDERVDVSLLPIGDGLTVCRKR